MLIGIEILYILCFPALIVFLSKRVPLLGKIGAIVLCYVFGFALSLLPVSYDKDLAQTIASVVIAVAIPLILFSMDVASVRLLAKNTIIGFFLLVISVLAVSFVAAVVAVKNGLEEGAALAGMTTGLYIGGTPNMFAVGNALLRNKNLINLANISDALVGGVLFFLVLTVLKGAYRRFLAQNNSSAILTKESESYDISGQNEYDYHSIPKDKKSQFRLFGVILLAAACLGVGALLEILINGNMDGSLFIMITVSVLGIAFSFIKPIRCVKGSYQVGQYFVLVFSLGLSMSIDFQKLVFDMLPTFLFFTCVQLASIVLHFILCRFFHIDGGTALITCIAGIYGPPFIAPIANAYGDKRLIVPGTICGTFGLVIGNILGIAFGSLLLAVI